jgi:hypothetical protein
MRLIQLPMTPEDVRERAIRILSPHLAQFGLTEIEVQKERDFDGTDVYRVLANVTQRVPSRVLVDSSDELQQLLRSEGEDRWIYLSTRRPTEPDEDEDEDEDEEDE